VFGGSVPDAGAVGSAAAVALIGLPLILVVAGPLGEELGWRGYVLPALLRRFRPVTATLILAPMWIVFHLPWIINRPDRFGPAWALALLGMVFTMTWLHLRTGSLALAITFHAVVNSVTPAVLQLFPEPERAAVWTIAAGL
jgi:uncharacterized protein